MAIDGISKELVNDANYGYYIEPENINEYEKVILKIIKNSDKLISLGNNG